MTTDAKRAVGGGGAANGRCPLTRDSHGLRGRCGDGTGNACKLMIATCFGNTNTGGFAEALVYGADNGAQIRSRTKLR